MPTFTSPKTYTVGEIHTSADHNTYERDNIRYLKGQLGTIAFEAGATFAGALAATYVNARSTGTNTAAGVTVGTSADAYHITLLSGRSGDTVGRVLFSGALTRLGFGTSNFDSTGVAELLHLYPSGGVHVSTGTPADPGAGVVAANTGMAIGSTNRSGFQFYAAGTDPGWLIDATNNNSTASFGLQSRTSGGTNKAQTLRSVAGAYAELGNHALTDFLRFYESGGVYLGHSNFADPGRDAMIVQGQLALGTGIASGVGIKNAYTVSLGSTDSGFGYYGAGSFTKTGGASGDQVGHYLAFGFTVNASATVVRATQLWAEGVTATVNGTLTNHNAAYFGTPVNGSTVKTIDTASGGGTPAHLTTSGTWTNASSFGRFKDLRGAVSDEEVDAWLEWIVSDEAAAHRYRYPTVWGTRRQPVFVDHPIWDQDEDGEWVQVGSERIQVGEEDIDCITSGGHQDWEHDSVFPLLDHMPDTLREAMTTEPGGSIGTKDFDGTAWALIRGLTKRVKRLEAQASANAEGKRRT